MRQRELQVCFISEALLEITPCFLFYPLPLDAPVVTCSAASLSASLPGYSGSEDCVAMETLLQGYDEQDEDQVYRVCNSPLLKYMDNDVSGFGIWLQLNLKCACFVYSRQCHMMWPKLPQSGTFFFFTRSFDIIWKKKMQVCIWFWLSQINLLKINLWVFIQ